MRRFIRKFLRRNSYKNTEIFPDEIFLDSHNLPKFDVHQFEGRLEKPIPRRVVTFLGAFFLIVGAIFISKIWILQVHKGQAYAEQSENNRLHNTTIFSNRGVIYDRNGLELASNTIDPNGADFAKRLYAPMPGLAHVVGYVKYPKKDSAGFYYQTEYVGIDGAERVFDEELSGENGMKIVETDALGKIKSQGVVDPPKDGENITLSIDAPLQSELHKAIKDISDQYGFRGGSGVIMDVYTGEILALTSFPEYSSEVMTDGKDVVKISEYQNDENHPLLNRVVSGLYTPGSTVKPFIALGALTEQTIDPKKQIFSSGAISVVNPYNPSQKTTFADWKAHGWVDMREALALSSNVYFYAVGGGYEDQKGLGISNIEKYIRMMGLGDKTEINLLGEAVGTIPSPAWKQKVFGDDPWRVGDTYHTSIGQYGFQLTPIEMVRSVGAIANNGTLVRPTILKKTLDELSAQNSRVVPIKDEHFKIVKEGMREAVFTVTAGLLNLPFVEVAAKTGTAELGVSKKLVNSWVTGFFPYGSPRYSFVVVLEKGARESQLGATAVMRHVFEWMNIYAQNYIAG